MSNTPTDAELKKLAEECEIGWAAGLGGMDDFLRAFASGVLAKWGAPQPAPLMPRGDSAAPQLRAMATNYPPGHLWDKLDAKACIKGALEIEALRAAIDAHKANTI